MIRLDGQQGIEEVDMVDLPADLHQEWGIFEDILR
jgi:hypothetical protein